MIAWVARDKDGSLWLFLLKPIKGLRKGAWEDGGYPMCRVHEEQFDPGYFDNVKWDDKEPTVCDYWPNPDDDMQYITLEKP